MCKVRNYESQYYTCILAKYAQEIKIKYTNRTLPKKQVNKLRTPLPSSVGPEKRTYQEKFNVLCPRSGSLILSTLTDGPNEEGGSALA